MLASDITITINGVESSALPAQDALIRAVVISLFTWRRADPDDVTDGAKFGWWGDNFNAELNDRIGSKLWLLAREKITDKTITRAREYTQQALQWLIDDAVASRVDVLVERFGLSGVAIQVTIYQKNQQPITLRFDSAWESLSVVH